MGDTSALLQTILAAAHHVAAVVKSSHANANKCRLIDKRVSAIAQCLEGSTFPAQLRSLPTAGQTSPLSDAKAAIDQAAKFVQDHGAAAAPAKPTSYQSVLSAFDEAVGSLGRASAALSTLLQSAGSAAPAAPLQHVAEAEARTAVAEDALHEFRQNPTMSLVIWVDNRPFLNAAIKKRIMSVPGICVIDCGYTEELKALLSAHDRNLLSSPGRLRVITNRARPDAFDAPLNEHAARDVVKLLRDQFSMKTPVLVFAGSNERAAAVNAELGSPAPYVYATAVSDVVVNYGRFATVVLVWTGALPASDQKAFEPIAQQGIVLHKLESVDAAVKFLTDCQGQLHSGSLRIVTNRHLVPLAAELTKLGCTAPLMVYTGAANLADTKAKWSGYAATHVTAAEKDLASFLLFDAKFSAPAAAAAAPGTPAATAQPASAPAATPTATAPTPTQPAVPIVSVPPPPAAAAVASAPHVAAPPQPTAPPMPAPATSPVVVTPSAPAAAAATATDAAPSMAPAALVASAPPIAASSTSPYAPSAPPIAQPPPPFNPAVVPPTPAAAPTAVSPAPAPAAASASAAPAPSAAGPHKVPKHFQLEINLSALHCENLHANESGGRIDPVCKISVRDTGELLGKTMALKKTLNPSWDVVFKFSRWANEVLRFEIWDKGLVSKTFAGECFVPVQSLGLATQGQTGQFDRTFKLQKRSGKKEDKVSGTFSFRADVKMLLVDLNS